MATWPEDLVTLLVNEGVGTAGVNIFISSQSSGPIKNESQLLITETGGSGATRVQNTAGDGYEHPSAQILVKGKSYVTARAMANAAYNALVKVRNETVNGTWYIEIRGLQRIIDIGLDENNHIRLAFNVLASKRP